VVPGWVPVEPAAARLSEAGLGALAHGHVDLTVAHGVLVVVVLYDAPVDVRRRVLCRQARAKSHICKIRFNFKLAAEYTNKTV